MPWLYRTSRTHFADGFEILLSNVTHRASVASTISWLIAPPHKPSDYTTIKLTEDNQHSREFLNGIRPGASKNQNWTKWVVTSIPILVFSTEQNVEIQQKCTFHDYYFISTFRNILLWMVITTHLVRALNFEFSELQAGFHSGTL